MANWLHCRRSGLIVCLPALLLGSASALRADARAEALFKQVRAASKAVQTLSAEYRMVNKMGDQSRTSHGTVRYRRPNYLRVQEAPPSKMAVISDGKDIYWVTPDNRYIKQPATPPMLRNSSNYLAPVGFLAGDDTAFREKFKGMRLRYAGRVRLEGRDHRVVNATLSTGDPKLSGIGGSARFYIGPENLITRTDVDFVAGKEHFKTSHSLRNLRLNAPMTPLSFAYVPPPGAQPLASKPDDEDANLVPVGADAPRFSLPSPAGKTVSLADGLQGKKAVIVNFWFYG